MSLDFFSEDDNVRISTIELLTWIDARIQLTEHEQDKEILYAIRNTVWRDGERFLAEQQEIQRITRAKAVRVTS